MWLKWFELVFPTSNKTSWVEGTFQSISVGWIRKKISSLLMVWPPFEKADEVLVNNSKFVVKENDF